MGQEIIIEAPNLWDYYLKHNDVLLKEMHKVAQNKDFGTEIYVTSENGYLSFLVTADDNTVYETTVLTKTDCDSVARYLYDNYLTDKFLTIVGNSFYESDDEEFTLETDDDLIKAREDSLDEAVQAFVEAVVIEDDDYLYINDFTEVYEDLKEHFLEYMYRKHNIPIYRPMFLEDEDGEEFFEEYPYDCLEFDYNPIFEQSEV